MQELRPRRTQNTRIHIIGHENEKHQLKFVLAVRTLVYVKQKKKGKKKVRYLKVKIKKNIISTIPRIQF